MSMGTIEINCPAMPVLNTGLPKFLGMRINLPGTDREAQEIKCTGRIILGGRVVEFMPVESDFAFRFPKCRVYRIRKGRWMVVPVIAWGRTILGEEIQISYPEESILRKGNLWSGSMIAQPIQNYLQNSYVYIDGIRHQIDAPLPEAEGKPNDGKFGLDSYLVEAVRIDGTVG